MIVASPDVVIRGIDGEPEDTLTTVPEPEDSIRGMLGAPVAVGEPPDETHHSIDPISTARTFAPVPPLVASIKHSTAEPSPVTRSEASHDIVNVSPGSSAVTEAALRRIAPR